MEADLARAVVVTVLGARPAVDLAAAAAALHAEFGIGPADMSIRPFYPEDFLVICEHPIIRQLMVDRGHASSASFELSLRPWLRQAQVTGANLPFLVPLRLVGVPGHAWNRRTAEVILRGLGFVEQIADRTARRFDMSGFHVWLRTMDPARILVSRRLYIEELQLSHGGHASDAPTALWYPISISVLVPPVRIDTAADGGPTPPLPPPPSPPSEEDSAPQGGHDRGGPRRHAGGQGSRGGSVASSAASAPPAHDTLGQAPHDAQPLAPPGAGPSFQLLRCRHYAG